jgi:preprotein translocase SecE subunit
MGNRALRRQQLRTKEGKAKRGGGAQGALPRTGPRPQTAAPARRHGIRRFVPQLFQDVWSELGKVVWPERDDVVYLTVVIVIITIIIGAFLGAIDIGFGWLIDKTLLN